MRQLLAPSASARNTSWPVRTPPSNITSISEPTASATFGSMEIEDGAPSSWRPPWLDTTSAVAPVLVSVRRVVESYESFVIQGWWPDSRRVTDVDGRKPRAVRPQQVAIPERFDQRRMAADRTFDSARQVRRRQADRDHARGRQRPHVHPLHRLSVARGSERPAAEEHDI